MKPEDVAAQLNDPWGALVLRRNVLPANLAEALRALDGAGTLPVQSSFFVSESGQIPVDRQSADLQRPLRMVIARSNGDASNPSVVFISAPAGEREGFLELMSWDPNKNSFNYYRRPALRQWIWKGDTRTAFRQGSAGNGCFACHVSGVPVMKELRFPWNNWHSIVPGAAVIPTEAVPEALRRDPLFLHKQGAEDLERLVRFWIEKATQARVTAFTQGPNTLLGGADLLRPLFETTTVNLTSSTDASESASPALALPVSFFLNPDLLKLLGLTLPANFKPAVGRELYRGAVAKFDLRLQSGDFSRKGDTHFALFVPEPALEDVATVGQLLARNIISQRFATCVTMIDFSNPIYSSVRATLLKYAPDSISDSKIDLSERTAAAIIQAAPSRGADSAEAGFSRCWTLAPDQLQAEQQKRIASYAQAVQDRLTTQSGVNDYMLLAQARRNHFADVSLLDEFDLLLPKTDPALKVDKTLHMNEDGSVTP
jgi:hypothetical protein